MAVTEAVKSRQFTADEKKGQLLRGNRRYLAKEGVVKRFRLQEE